jgi:hypothetical protein
LTRSSGSARLPRHRWRESVFTGVVTQRWEALVTSPRESTEFKRPPPPVAPSMSQYYVNTLGICDCIHTGTLCVCVCVCVCERERERERALTNGCIGCELFIVLEIVLLLQHSSTEEWPL